MELVDIHIFWPWGFLILLMRVLPIYFAAHVLMKDRFHPAVTLGALLAVTAPYRYLVGEGGKYEILQLLGFYILLFLVMLVCKQTNFGTTLLLTAAACLVQQLCAFFSFVPLALISRDSLYYMTAYTMPRQLILAYLLYALLFGSALAMLLRMLVVRRRQKTEPRLRTRYGFLVLFPLSHILCSALYFLLIQAVGKDVYDQYIGRYQYINIFVIVIFVTCLLLDFSLLFIVERLEKAEQRALETERQLVQNRMDYESATMLRDEKQEFRKVKHDLSNLLTVARGYIEIGKPEKALAVLSDTQAQLGGLSGFTACANETVNVVLYIKQNQAKAAGARLAFDVAESDGARVDDYDLCRVLFNLIDNGLHAVEPLPEAERTVKLRLSIEKERLQIETQNPYLPARRKTKQSGTGTDILRGICKKYGGSYMAFPEDGVYRTVTVLENRPPRGQDK